MHFQNSGQHKHCEDIIIKVINFGINSSQFISRLVVDVSLCLLSCSSTFHCVKIVQEASLAACQLGKWTASNEQV